MLQAPHLAFIAEPNLTFGSRFLRHYVPAGMEKSVKKIINKFVILLLIFAVVIGIYFFINRDKKEDKNIIMGEPTLPTISFMASGETASANDIEVNELFGYTTEMETKYMRDTITPINDERKITVRVNNHENVVMGAEFEVRTLDCERLIEKTEVKAENIKADGDYTNIDIQLDNMIEADTEYYLVIRLTTDRNENVYFYTRIKQLTENHCKEEMEFAKKFSDSTFSDTESENIINYLETNASEDNSNFGKVNIHSSYKQITWGDLKPEKVTNPVVRVQEILGDIGCYKLVYKIKALNDYDAYQYYTVTEFFRVKWTSSEIYLLDYERTMNQIFDANNQNISAYRINLGISENSDVGFKSSDDTSYIAFAKENGLWLMDIGENKVYSLFAFEEVETADIRDTNNDNDFQVVSVDNDGNVKFIVYGYMNRGEHEGMVGVSLYEYNHKKNLVEEKIFIPFTRKFDILKQTMGRLSYVNDKDIMYVMLSDSVYSIDLTGSEYVQVISNLKEDNYAVNSNGNIVAWETDGSDKGSSSVKMLNLENGEECEIKAEDGHKLKVLGFLGDDMVYGDALESDIITDNNGNVTVGMNKVIIADIKGEELKSYSKEGYYISGADVSDNMVNLTRVQKTPEGSTYVKSSDYQIFGNEEEDTSVVSSGIITTDLKKKEVVISFVKKVTTSSQLKSLYPKEIRFSETNSLSIRELINGEDKYYVYGQGKMQSVSDNVSDAIIAADRTAGVVISESGDYVWARMSKPTQYELTDVAFTGTAESGNSTAQLALCVQAILMHNGVNTDVASELAGGKTSVQIINEKISDKTGLDLTGCSLSEVLYYVWNGQPVLASTDGTNYVLIVGYDFYNVVMLNPVTGQTYKMGQDEAGAMFDNTGNKFIAIK